MAQQLMDAIEAPGLDLICRGLSMVRTDEEALDIGAAMFDGLFEHRRRALLFGSDPR